MGRMLVRLGRKSVWAAQVLFGATEPDEKCESYGAGHTLLTKYSHLSYQIYLYSWPQLKVLKLILREINNRESKSMNIAHHDNNS